MTINVFGGGNTGGPAFPVQRSVRLRSSASAYFSRTLASTTNRRTFTLSGWVKRGTLGVDSNIFGASSDNFVSNYFSIYFGSGNGIRIQNITAGAVNFDCSTSAVYRDTSSWYHIVVAIDTTQATSTERLKLWVNGSQVTAFSPSTYPSLNFDTFVNSNSFAHTLGRVSFDGYLTEVNFIDGQALTPSSFGSINSTTGVWQPIKYSGTYGTNGFYLNFNDNSAATAAAIGKDSSGNGNNWTPSAGISLTSGATYDSMLDVPTLTSATNANFCVLNPLDKGTTVTVQNANLQSVIAATHNGVRGTFQIPTSGKWYWEVAINTTTTNSIIGSFGVATASASLNTYDYNTTGTYSLYCQGSPALNFIVNGSIGTTFGSAVTGGTVCNVAYDADNGQLYLGVANTYYSSAGAGTGNPATATNPSMAVAASLGLFPYIHVYNETIDINFGQRPFTHPVPSGFKSLNTYNLPAPTIPNGATQFAATTYTGTGSSLAISNTVNGKSFQPDLVWVKGRSGATDHALYDSVRGTTKQLESNTTTAETTEATGLTAFDTSGFTVGALAQMNTNTATYVGWQWKASNAAPVTNTLGSITSSVSANPSAGFSIVTYTGTGANATVGHGLGVAPKMVIVKVRSTTNDGVVYHSSIGNTGAVFLDLTNATSTSINYWNNTSPTSTAFTIGIAAGVNNSTSTFVAYCWAEIPGFSKFGSYTGNGATDGPFVYCGFRPKFVMIKNASTVTDWWMMDTSRDTYNVVNNVLVADSSGSESSLGAPWAAIDILSNGFKARITNAGVNGSGNTLVFMAFAESPFNYSLAR